MAIEPYRPSSGSEGVWFIGRWCDRCVNDSPDSPCSVLSATFAHEIDDPSYPSEWVEDDGRPHCTAFADHDPSPPTIIRDARQTELPL